MTTQMCKPIDSVLSSTARTVRAVALIVVLALAPGLVSALDVVAPGYPTVPARHVDAGDQAAR